MSTKDFYYEVINSSYCPENFDKVYSKFEIYQKDGLRTLNEVHRICEQRNIRYILGYGSLLGAIRDNGIIPWDYDVDIFVPYEEKKRFISALNEELSKDYYYECPDNCSSFPSFMIRVSPNEYDTLSVHVDVFYIIGASDIKIEQDMLAEQIKKLCLDRSKKLTQFKKKEQRNLKTFLITYIAKLRRLGMSVSEIDNRLKGICEKYNPKESNVSMVVCSVYDNVFRYPTDLLWDTKLMKTDVGEFRVPKTYDRVLTQLYGDYCRFPPLDKRIDEMMHYYHMLNHLDVCYNKNVEGINGKSEL